MTKIITIANAKGGVAKTTSVAAIGDVLARIMHQKVLLIDAATLNNLSRRFGYDANHLKTDKTLDAYLRSEVKSRKFFSDEPIDIVPFIHDGIMNKPRHEKECKYENLSIIYSTQDLDCVYNSSLGLGKDSIIRTLLTQLRNLKKYDYIIIDTSPAFKNAQIRNDFIAGSDYLMIPSFSDPDSINGAEWVLESFNSIVDSKKKNEEPLTKFLGLFFCNIRVNDSDFYEQISNLEMQFDSKYIFNSLILKSTSVCNSGSMDMPVTSAYPSSVTSVGYIMLVREMLSRIRDDDAIIEK